MKNYNDATKHKYRMVALDLDGTLLGPDHTISDTAIDYLNLLHNKGFLVTLATGRSSASTFDTIKRLRFPLSDPHGIPVVCFNGAMGMKVKGSDDLSTGNVAVTELFHQPVPHSVTQRLVSTYCDSQPMRQVSSSQRFCFVKNSPWAPGTSGN